MEIYCSRNRDEIRNEINYSNFCKNKDYYRDDKFREKLLKASQGYCMYCGKRVIIDKESHSHIEHSIDKDRFTNQRKCDDDLSRCKWNLSISCSVCNTKYKNRVTEMDLSDFKPKCHTECIDNCDLKKCDKIKKPRKFQPIESVCKNDVCPEYRKIYEEYIKRNKIILNPLGYKLNGKDAVIKYDILRGIFVPPIDLIISDDNDDKSLVDLIDSHIYRFDFNGDRYTEIVEDLCSQIVATIELNEHKDNSTILNIIEICNKNKNSYNPYKYDNYLGITFMEYLKEFFAKKSAEELMDFCELIICLESVYKCNNK